MASPGKTGFVLDGRRTLLLGRDQNARFASTMVMRWAGGGAAALQRQDLVQ